MALIFRLHAQADFKTTPPIENTSCQLNIVDSAHQSQFQRDTAALTNEVPIIAGDILRTIRTPAVLPSISTAMTGSDFQFPKVQNVSPADKENNHGINTSTPAARRLSTGEAFAAEVGIDLRAIGLAEARKIMSVEHKVLGFRPPHDSLAAAAQAAAARHPEGEVVEDEATEGVFEGPAVSTTTNGNGNEKGQKRRLSIDAQKLREAAREDAQRILSERTKQPPSPVASMTAAVTGPSTKTKHKTAIAEAASDTEIDLGTLSIEDARTLISAEHRALGYRPPAGSLAAAAQRVAAKATAGSEVPTTASDVSGDRARSSSGPTNSNETAKGAKHRRRSSASASTTSASISPTASPKARARRFSNQARAPGQSPEKGRRSLSLGHGGDGNVNARRGSSGSGSGSGVGGKEQKEREREEVLRAAALKDAERIRAQRDADPRAQVVSADPSTITEAGGKVEVGAERLVNADVNNLAAQVQAQTQGQDASAPPVTSPSAYTAAAFPSSETRTPAEVPSSASSPTPSTTSAAYGQNAVQSLGDAGGESGEDISDPLASDTLAPTSTAANINPDTNAKTALTVSDELPVEEGGYVEDVEDKEDGVGKDKPELVRTETEDSVQIIGDVLA
ncbi:hypothetical protein EIP86_002579 [Pleurotus ostreatoroseus]|nr:hypothetical protein EIP86_002579 [Pleurotus ostreatoroseus]